MAKNPAGRIKRLRAWLSALGDRGWAIALVSVVLSVAIVSAVVPGFRICHDRLATTGNEATARLCEPLIGEPGLLALLALLVVLLLLPLLSKFDIAGLFGVELRDVRRTAEAAKESADLAKEVANVAEQHASTARRQATEIASLQQEVQRLQDQLMIRVGVIEGGGLSESPATRILEATSVDEGAQDAELMTRFLSLWREIEVWAFINKRGAQLGITSQRARAIRPDGTPLTTSQRQAVEQWRRLFGFEVDFLSRIRNSIVHDPSRLRSNDLRSALDTAELVMAALRKALDRR